MKISSFILLLLEAIFLASCTHDSVEDMAHGYPEEVGTIFRGTCATSGCHTARSAAASAGLNLETWESLFLGGNGGSAVIPYSPQQSYLMFSINSDSTLGPMLKPTMPVGAPHLDPYAYETIRQWIEDGARNAKGEEKFPPLHDRRKLYVLHQGCDLVAVIDLESAQVMRYIEIGHLDGREEMAYDIATSPDGKWWYVIFAADNPYLELYSTLDDKRVATVSLGHLNWHDMAISPDGKWAFVVSAGFWDLSVVDLQQRQLAQSNYLIGNPAVDVTCHPMNPRLYVATNTKEELILLDYGMDGATSYAGVVDLIQNQPPANGPDLLAGSVEFSTDGGQYFVSCYGSHEIRIFDATNDSLLHVVEVAKGPTEMVHDPVTNRLFVACQDELDAWGGAEGKKGGIVIVDIASGQQTALIYAGNEPHGLSLDPAAKHLYIAARNRNGFGQHHATICGSSNGILRRLDIETLEMDPDYRQELSADPYSLAVKR